MLGTFNIIGFVKLWYCLLLLVRGRSCIIYVPIHDVPPSSLLTLLTFGLLLSVTEHEYMQINGSRIYVNESDGVIGPMLCVLVSLVSQFYGFRGVIGCVISWFKGFHGFHGFIGFLVS